MVSVDRKIDELIDNCIKLGLKPIPTKTNKKGIILTPFDILEDENGVGKTLSKEDCVRSLQSYYCNIYKEEGRYTEALDWILKKEFQPMLANRLSSCNWKDDIYNRDNEVIAETKIDGNRSVWCLLNKDEGIQIFGRNLSVQDFLPMCYSDKVYMDVDYSKITHTFIIDGEIVISKLPADDILEGYGLQPGTTQLNLTSALLSSEQGSAYEFQKHYPLKLMVFDIVMMDGVDLTDRPLSERLEKVDIIYKELVEAGVRIERPHNNRELGLSVEEFHKKMLMNNEEGSIVKILNSTYYTNGSRSHNAWIKLKRSVTSSLAEQKLGDTVDAFVTGFTNVKDSSTNSWRVGALEFSVWVIDDDIFSDTHDQNLYTKVVAHVSGLTESDAKRLSEPDPDNPGYCRLKKDAYGLVAEISGQDFAPRSQTLTHPRLIRWRDDKPVNQCTLSKNFIELTMLNRETKERN